MLSGMTVRLLVCLMLAALLAGCGSPPATQVTAATPLPERSLAANPTPAAEIKVYVTGAVAHPGVYALTPDSRVEDAVTAAGGFVDGADQPRVNLAAKVRDEEEIFVPRVGETTPSLVAGAEAVTINTASATQLRQALGISSTIAGHIVSYRRQHGPFKSVDDLRLVPVSDADLNRIRQLVSTR
jgi:competence protein ComEA